MKDVISMNLKGKTIVLGITGGIAAYKMPMWPTRWSNWAPTSMC